ncbi:MurR/RpiR family transcriptional regulator [Mycoplasmopsis cynos]|uniref:MurR/RpiR family transcriptional regulator n=1 Tax=Mycoplasmopsis cynos TaxID=171284 RepID=UPI002AFF2E9C|nr:MurR/RpiR family transcriptional regulator [Mycoplasmopsis cynos]WQQ14693.1 MurR/RpiR family transcriptional regulator [Mycoplasmopsis cynos]
MKTNSPIIETSLLNKFKKSPKKGTINWKILELIENEPQEFLAHNTISLAKKLKIGQASISRFSRSLDFSTFNELQLYVSTRYQHKKDYELNIIEGTNLTLDDTISNIRSHYLFAIEKTIEWIKHNPELNIYIETLLKYRKVNIIFGIGESGLVAKYFAYNLRKIGFNAIFLDDLHEFFSFAQIIKPKMHITIISKSCQTLEVKKILNYLEDNQIKYSIWTKNEKMKKYNPNNVLIIDSINQNYRIGTLGSKVSALMVADIIYSFLALKIDKDKIIFNNIKNLIDDWNELLPNKE